MKIKINESLVIVYDVFYASMIGTCLYFLINQEHRAPGASGVEASIGNASVLVFIACAISLIPIPFSIYFLIVKKHLSKTLFLFSQLPFCLSLLFWMVLLVMMAG